MFTADSVNIIVKPMMFTVIVYMKKKSVFYKVTAIMNKTSSQTNALIVLQDLYCVRSDLGNLLKALGRLDEAKVGHL